MLGRPPRTQPVGTDVSQRRRRLGTQVTLLELGDERKRAGDRAKDRCR